MKLIGTTSSPFVRKVRVVALEKQLPLEFVIDSPLTANSSVPSYNPLGKVPVLLRDDGGALIDSPLIVEYLDSLVEMPRLIPASLPERMPVRQWEALADGVSDAAVLWRMENLRPATERSASWIERQQGKVESALAFTNRELTGRTWLVGETLTLADVALGCCIGYLEFRFAMQNWRGRFAEVGRLMIELERRESFRATTMA